MRNDIRYRHIIEAVASTPWAIVPAKLAEITAFLRLKAAGGDVDDQLLTDYRAAAARRPKLRSNGDIAVLPLTGTISHRMGMMSEMSGGTSVEGFTRDFRALLNDPSVAAIVLDVDSPGGSVAGIEELANEIFRSRGVKPISSVANTLMASAAYWLASAADEVVVTPSGEVGSVGVLAAHEDHSGELEQAGVRVSLITAGKHKAEANPFEPLSDEGRAAIQARVDDAYGMFTKALARQRGVPLDTVRNGFGEGRVVGAREAVRLGMADRVATLDDVIATIGRRRTSAPAGEQAATLEPIPAWAQLPPILTDDNGIVINTARWSGAATTFENEAETVLTTVRAFQARVEALTSLRAGRSPLSQANIPRIAAHRDAYRAVADAYDALLAACAPESPAFDRAALRALELAHLATEARLLGVPLI